MGWSWREVEFWGRDLVGILGGERVLFGGWVVNFFFDEKIFFFNFFLFLRKKFFFFDFFYFLREKFFFSKFFWFFDFFLFFFKFFCISLIFFYFFAFFLCIPSAGHARGHIFRRWSQASSFFSTNSPPADLENFRLSFFSDGQNFCPFAWRILGDFLRTPDNLCQRELAFSTFLVLFSAKTWSSHKKGDSCTASYDFVGVFF